MVEPIQRVLGPRGGIDPVAPLEHLHAVARREEREEETPERRQKRRQEPAEGAVRLDADGRPRVDVQA